MSQQEPWPPPSTLAGLATKYRELLALRRERALGAPPAPRAVMRRLSADFPGALRELDTMVEAELAERAAALEAAAAGGPRFAWMAYVAAYHALYRTALAASVESEPGLPISEAARAHVRSPLHGRRTQAVIHAIAEAFGVTAHDVAHAVLPRRRGGRSYRPMSESLDTRTRILSAADVRAILSMKSAVEAVELAFADHARGVAQMPAKVYLTLEAHAGDFRAMPSYVGAGGGQSAAAGVKWVNSHPDNPKRHGLPSVMGVYILSDPATALPLAILDATVLTAARTGAAAAVASKHLAKPGPKTIGFVGSGVQARWMLEAHRVVFGDALEVLASDIDQAAAEAFVKTWGGRATSVEEASGCDIVCTSTPGRSVAVQRTWVKPGAHINAMGADAPGKQELDPAILDGAVIVIDEHHQATHSGEVNVPLSRGELREDQLFATLGEIVTGAKKIARDGSTITLFDSTGLAVQDVALARVLFAEASKRDVGQRIALVG
jgi:alanine dehydrogenase